MSYFVLFICPRKIPSIRSIAISLLQFDYCHPTFTISLFLSFSLSLLYLLTILILILPLPLRSEYTHLLCFFIYFLLASPELPARRCSTNDETALRSATFHFTKCSSIRRSSFFGPFRCRVSAPEKLSVGRASNVCHDVAVIVIAQS